MNRISKDEYYLGIALAVSKRSTCLKRRYGCVIVKDDIIISTGYNGSPRQTENCCDKGICARQNEKRYEGYEKCNSVHAEQNALLAPDRNKLIGAIMYLACESLESITSPLGHHTSKVWLKDSNPEPCNICLNMIKNAGILKVINETGEVFKNVCV